MEKASPSSSGPTAQLSPLSLFRPAPFLPTTWLAYSIPTRRPKQAALQVGPGRPRGRAAFPLLRPAPTLPSPAWTYSDPAQQRSLCLPPPSVPLTKRPVRQRLPIPPAVPVADSVWEPVAAHPTLPRIWLVPHAWTPINKDPSSCRPPLTLEQPPCSPSYTTAHSGSCRSVELA